MKKQRFARKLCSLQAFPDGLAARDTLLFWRRRSVPAADSMEVVQCGHCGKWHICREEKCREAAA